jgi:SAM-dependent methyltransferase
VMNVEVLDLPDASVDLVCASGVLHHLDYERTYAELARVLRDDGEVLFLEPLAHNPLIEWYRRRTPHERSEDEHPLRTEDVEIARRWFHDVDAEFHDLTALAAAFVPPSWTPHVAPVLQRFDDWLFRRVPRLRRYAWVVVLRAGRPRRADAAVKIDLTAAETTATTVSLAGEELVDQLDERGPVGVDRRVTDEAHRTP